MQWRRQRNEAQASYRSCGYQSPDLCLSQEKESETEGRYGRGAFCGRRSLIARTGGAHRRENAGMSSVMSVRTRHTESLRVPGQRQSSQGQSGPKPRTSRRRRWKAGWIVLHRSASFERGRDAVGKVNRSNGQDRLLARSASPRKSPVATSMTTGTSVRESAEVTGPQAAEKSF